MNILVLHGPNLNLLGKRNPSHYGTETLDEINQRLHAAAKERSCSLDIFQSNHEGALIDFIQEHAPRADGILINPAALTHYSIALRDALEDSGLPIVEVHLSDIASREPFRRVSYISGIALATVQGKRGASYTEGLNLLIDHITNKTS